MCKIAEPPKVTVVTVTYNAEKYLEQTIKSIIEQNYPNLEYIIIDGASTDGTVDIIKKYEKQIDYWMSEPDGGMYEAIQKGFDKSTGEVMAWINSDDMYHPNTFFTVAEIFSLSSEIEWLTGANTNFDERGRTINTRPSYKHSRYSQFLHPNRHIQQESTFWKRGLWNRAGARLDTSLKYAGDFELWLRFNRFSQIYITDALIGGFRHRANQLTKLFMHKYKDECQEVLQREMELLTTYEKNILQELESLEDQLLLSPIQKHEKLLIESQIKKLSKENEKIIFNAQKQKFEFRSNKMNNALSIISKRRNNMGDFLKMIKEQHGYYPEVVIDVGVANGTPELYRTFPESQFILFEPLEEFIPDMERYKSEYKNISIEMCALGSQMGEVEFNVHPDLVGSSLYMEDEGSDVNGEKRRIPLKTLDSFQEKYNLYGKPILLKVDVQGAEIDVLEGAGFLMSTIDIVILETSLFNFFNNNNEFTEVINYMNKKGFVVYDIFNFINRPFDSALAQVDVAFVKKDSSFRRSHVFATKEQRAALNNELKQKNKGFSENVLDASYDFSKQYNKLYETIEMLKQKSSSFLIYGYGTIGKTIHAIMLDKIVGYVDMSDEKHHPSNIPAMSFDKIIISVLGREREIIKYLTEELHVNSGKIITLEI